MQKRDIKVLSVSKSTLQSLIERPKKSSGFQTGEFTGFSRRRAQVTVRLGDESRRHFVRCAVVAADCAKTIYILHSGMTVFESAGMTFFENLETGQKNLGVNKTILPHVYIWLFPFPRLFQEQRLNIHSLPFQGLANVRRLRPLFPGLRIIFPIVIEDLIDPLAQFRVLNRK